LVRPVDATRTIQWAAVGVAVALAITAPACGGDEEFANRPRPPATLQISAVIAPTRVTVSPSRFGAGPIELIASNQTSISQRLTLRSQRLIAGADQLNQRTAPINPGDTASLKADLAEGVYSVSASSATIRGARIRVGPPRVSAKDRLLQP
jgi:hypothetical protein